MSTEVVPSIVEFDNDVTELSTAVAMAAPDMPSNGSESITVPDPSDQFVLNASAHNTTDIVNALNSEFSLFQTFIVIEIAMTTLEVIISIFAAIKMPRWRRNYRNQMLMQLTFARFIKRIIATFKFLEDNNRIASTEIVTNIINCFQIYIDFVIVILVFFFIKHMYNSLIIVLVKISQNSFYRVLTCSWLIPLPISAACTTVIVTGVMDKWYVYLLICCIFRWPLMFVGSGLYIAIVYRVLSDKIRQFARSLAVVTFLLCLTINIYLLSKDVIELWCLTSSTATLLMSNISGLLMNLLVLVLYILLLVLSYNNKTQSSRSLPDYSLADVNNKI